MVDMCRRLALVCSNVCTVCDHLQDNAEALLDSINEIDHSVLCCEVDFIVSDYIKAARVNKNQKPSDTL